MKTLTKTEFREQTALDLVKDNEVIAITCWQGIIGYWVPTEKFMAMQATIKHAAIARAEEKSDAAT